ncbi:MAG TPA: PadR family transcriptional regulator [Candidatus Nanopelagicaceae bacterium]|nr:PadR family transcriptional regulator [Candidatus Nanopelagicaceae bacterium]
MATRKSQTLELAILGTLKEGELHGYELRKRTLALIGQVRSLSYGSLYPALRDLTQSGYLQVDESAAHGVRRGANPRARISYSLTAAGKERLNELLAEAGPKEWDDESFAVRLALFSQTDVRVRVRILEGRHTKLVERLEAIRESLSRGMERMDSWTLELQRHGEEAVEREVRWLNELIDNARSEEKEMNK